ncbi:MAG: (5-formylfuran-3-yl)methyl phosphate synthase [Pirellulales bacterium]
MTECHSGLLVSVRNATEAALVADLPVEVIDVKEPDNGSLGCVDLSCLEEICRRIGRGRTISMAMGELQEARAWDPAKVPAEVRYAKLGLAGCRGLPNWREAWRRELARLPSHVRPVAVVYADDSANAPAADEIVAGAAALDCAAVLVDTHCKSGGGLPSYWNFDRITEFVQETRRLGMFAVIAGGVTLDDLPSIVSARPRLIGVRGAVCGGFRENSIRVEQVREFAARLSGCLVAS